MKSLIRKFAFASLVLACLTLSGCSSNVGVGVSVGVPVGNHGFVSVGGSTNRWR